MSGPTLGPVRTVLAEGLAGGVAPALAAVVLRRGEILHASAHGSAAGRPALFDVASLTKVMATGTLAARLVAAGALDLDVPAGRWLPGFGGDKRDVTVRHLLAHTSGLPAWRPLGRLAHLPARAPSEGSPMPIEAAIAAEPLEARPGQRAVYSDLGFIALGMVLERVAGAPLDALFDERVAAPLRLSACFLPGRLPPEAAARRAAHRFVPTVQGDSGEVRLGLVHDDNARALGGVAGHAGLFASAADAAALGQAWLEAWANGSPFLPREVARLFAARLPGAGTRALAWDTPSAPAGAALGERLGRGPAGAIGHLGFTGCSLWVDLDDALVLALLTSQCPRVGEVEAMRAFRRRFHGAVAEALAGSP